MVLVYKVTTSGKLSSFANTAPVLIGYFDFQGAWGETRKLVSDWLRQNGYTRVNDSSRYVNCVLGTKNGYCSEFHLHYTDKLEVERA